MQRRFAVPVVASLAFGMLSASLPRAAAGDVTTGGPKVGQWKTWVLASASEIPVPPPPAENSDQAKAELAELRQLQKGRTAIVNVAIQYYNAVPATQRWHDQAFALAKQEKLNLTRTARLLAILHTAMHDAVVATWAAKYTYNRKAPSQVAPDLVPTATVASETAPPEPSYPSEHAAIAGTAVGILSAFFPKETDNLAAMAQEANLTRLQMGANYRSDVEAGFALGQAVAQKANARAAADGSSAQWTGTVPIGPGLWVGTNPSEPLAGQWKPWLMTSGSQFRPGPPPAIDSPQFQAELAEVKQLSSHATPSQKVLAVQWNSLDTGWAIAYDLIRRDRLSTPRAARVLAPFSAVQLDGYIANNDAKYTYWRIRPYQADPTIVPLVAPPGHPSYPSNAGTINTSSLEVLAYFFPQDAFRLRYLEEEAGLARIFGGVHFRSDVEASQPMGRGIAALAIQRDQMNGE